MASSLKDLIADKKKFSQLAKAAFDAVDTDKSGFLEREELEQIMTMKNPDFPSEHDPSQDIDEIFKEIDSNGDGKFSFEEFKD